MLPTEPARLERAKSDAPLAFGSNPSNRKKSRTGINRTGTRPNMVAMAIGQASLTGPSSNALAKKLPTSTGGHSTRSAVR